MTTLQNQVQDLRNEGSRLWNSGALALTGSEGGGVYKKKANNVPMEEDRVPQTLYDVSLPNMTMTQVKRLTAAIKTDIPSYRGGVTYRPI